MRRRTAAIPSSTTPPRPEPEIDLRPVPRRTTHAARRSPVEPATMMTFVTRGRRGDTPEDPSEPHMEPEGTKKRRALDTGCRRPSFPVSTLRTCDLRHTPRKSGLRVNPTRTADQRPGPFL